MNLDNILQNIEQVKSEELENSQRKANEMSVESEQDPSQVMFDDYTKQYFEDVRAIRKKASRGASGRVLIFTRLLVLGDKKKRIDGLKKAYARVKMDIEQYKNYRPELVEPFKRRYLEEKFLPVVEAIIMQTSPEDLYNSTSSLELLDKYVCLNKSNVVKITIRQNLFRWHTSQGSCGVASCFIVNITLHNKEVR